jgi:hypothetical protein
VIRHQENGYVLVHSNDEIEEDHGAVEDDGSYLPGLNRN